MNELCVVCKKNQPPENRKICIDCLAKMKINNDARRKRLIESGICYYCGKKPAIPGQKRCIKCSTVDAERRRSVVTERRSKTVCTQCGNELDSPKSNSLCQKCLTAKSASQRRRRAERKTTGICVECSEPICNKSAQFCERHWLIYNQRSREYYFDGLRHPTLQRDNFACCICGDNTTRLDVHHIDLDRNHNDLSNLITLCSQCHRTITHILRCNCPNKIIEFVKVHYAVI